MIKEKHGIANAKKIAMVTIEEQAVTVTDGDGMVCLALSTSSYPAGMTPEQARFVAKQLAASADRIDRAAARKEPT